MGESNSNEILKMVAGIVITLLVISLGFLIYRVGRNGVGNAMNEVENMNNSLSESKFTDYEGQSVTGSQLQSLLNTWANEDVCIRVTDMTASYVYNYDDGKLATTANVLPNNSATRKSNANYINPSASFETTVVRNSNGVIVGMEFVQEGATAPAAMATN